MEGNRLASWAAIVKENLTKNQAPARPIATPPVATPENGSSSPRLVLRADGQTDAAFQEVTDQLCAIIDSFEERLSDLEKTVLPIQTTTQGLTRAHENVDRAVSGLNEVLEQLRSVRKVERRILGGLQGDLDSYVDAIDRLQDAVEFMEEHKSYRAVQASLRHARDLLERAMRAIEDEFTLLLGRHSAPMQPKELVARPGEKLDLKPLPEDIVAQLKSLVIHMLANGHTRCLGKYEEVRGAVVGDTLLSLGASKVTDDEMQKLSWEMLEERVATWISNVRVVGRMLEAERSMAASLIPASYMEDVLGAVATGGMQLLLESGEQIAAHSRTTPEKVFALLDMYENLRAALPILDAVLDPGEAATPAEEVSERPPHSTSSVSSKARALLAFIAEKARDTFANFEAAVEQDRSGAAGKGKGAADGTVHPLSSYVINYLKRLFQFKHSMDVLFGSGCSGGQGGGAAREDLAVAAMRILMVLVGNLDGKSADLRPPALASVFNMNNVHYIVKAVKGSELADLLGAEWISRHEQLTAQHAADYIERSWSRLVQVLTDETSVAGKATLLSRGRDKERLKARFRAANEQLEGLHEAQVQWSVPDPELRATVKNSVLAAVMPPYRAFIEEHGTVPFSRNMDKYVRHLPEEVERMVGDLFESQRPG